MTDWNSYTTTLPVITRSTPANGISAWLKYSTLSYQQNNPSADMVSHQILEMGNGKILIGRTSERSTLKSHFTLFTFTEYSQILILL